MLYIDNLSSLKEGQNARVRELCISGSMRRRLQDIGLIRGTKVLCVHKSPPGDPAAYMIRGAVIAIRSCDAQKIIVELTE